MKTIGATPRRRNTMSPPKGGTSVSRPPTRPLQPYSRTAPRVLPGKSGRVLSIGRCQMRRLGTLVLVWIGLFGQFATAQERPAPPPPRVDVILWFDTEDYLLPADDDACLRLAELLSKRQ